MSEELTKILHIVTETDKKVAVLDEKVDHINSSHASCFSSNIVAHVEYDKRLKGLETNNAYSKGKDFWKDMVARGVIIILGFGTLGVIIRECITKAFGG